MLANEMYECIRMKGDGGEMERMRSRERTSQKRAKKKKEEAGDRAGIVHLERSLYVSEPCRRLVEGPRIFPT